MEVDENVTNNKDDEEDEALPSTSTCNLAPSTPTGSQLFVPHAAIKYSLPKPASASPPSVAANGVIRCPVSLPLPTTGSSSVDRTDNRDPHCKFPEEARDMRREEDRLKTFDKWPLSFLSPERLARNGFYYLGRGDEVRCAFCHVEIMKWVEGDDPACDHQRWAPQCPFLRRQAGAGNVPLDAPAPAGRDECGTQAPAPAALGQPRLPEPVHPRYSTEAARLHTFDEWPRSMRQKPKDLAEAGFFYTGQSDKTKCFYCDGGLKDWESDDVPWEQHARWFDRCPYVRLVKGPEYIQKVKTEACMVPAKERSGEASTSAAGEEAAPAKSGGRESPDDEGACTVSDEKLCKICYAEERNVCLIPCGHVVACAKCTLSTNKCPMCRRPFVNAMRIYFS